MDWLALIYQIFEVCIIPLLGVLTTYLINYISTQKEKVKEQIGNEKLNKYIDLLAEAIKASVVATNQTYVETLKKEGKFDKEAQLKAFELTKQAVLGILSQDAKICLQEAFGDLNAYIDNSIEATVVFEKA